MQINRQSEEKFEESFCAMPLTQDYLGGWWSFRSCTQVPPTTTCGDHLPGGGAIRPFPRDGSAEELRRDPTVGPHSKVWTRGQKWKK